MSGSLRLFYNFIQVKCTCCVHVLFIRILYCKHNTFWLHRFCCGCVFVCVAWCVYVCVSVCGVCCVGVVCLSPEANGPCGPEWHFIAGATLVEAAYPAWEESHTNENVTLAIISGLEDVCILDERSPDDVL